MHAVVTAQREGIGKFSRTLDDRLRDLDDEEMWSVLRQSLACRYDRGLVGGYLARAPR